MHGGSSPSSITNYLINNEEYYNIWVSFVRIAWPSGLRRWFKAPVTSVAWVRIPPLSTFLILFNFNQPYINKGKKC